MLEYKENLSASFAREVVALANTSGGKILLGVRDDGTVKGIPDSNELRARIQDIARNCDPPVKVLVQRVGEVTVITVEESDAKPVQCSDGFFWRQGAVTQKLSRDEIRDFFRSEGVIRFDLSLCPKFRYPQDFDREKYDAWLRLSGITGRPRTEDVLVNIEAAERSGGSLVFRNAGVLFFARNVRHFFNQAYITCLLAKGADKVHVLDRKDFDGGIVADIEDAMRFVERNTRTAWRIEGLRREDIPEYPMKALREAITNAVMHRDWFMDGANVFVEIYTDRIEVSSPGGLPKGMTLSDLGRKSIRRNALIADLLHRITFIEKAGTGIKRIRDEAREQGCPEPVFQETGFFTATFYPNPEVRILAATMRPTSSRDQEAGEVTTEVTTEATTEVRLLMALKGEMTRQALLSALALKNDEHFRKAYLLPALEAGFIEMTIPDKPRSPKQRYRITPLGRETLEKKLKER
jgi:ATP-dependent DNA helicase RecG